MSYTITIKKGNLLQEDGADFIINASNTSLILGSGVSMAFKRHCGLELQDAMNEELSKRGKLSKGDVVRTPSFASNFEYALHCAVMDYNQGEKQRDPTLLTILNILKNIELELENYSTHFQKKIKIVLPLLGCGVGGLSKKDVIEIYKKHFSKEIDFVCEVVIYGYDEEDFLLLKEYFK